MVVFSANFIRLLLTLVDLVESTCPVMPIRVDASTVGFYLAVGEVALAESIIAEGFEGLPFFLRHEVVGFP